jgi:hypothetical protein
MMAAGYSQAKVLEAWDEARRLGYTESKAVMPVSLC